MRRCPLELSVHGAGTTTSIEIAGAILGIGRTKAYELARTGGFPVALIRAGRRYVVPVPALLACSPGSDGPGSLRRGLPRATPFVAAY